jgi:cytochrome c oxidase subunit 3
VLALAVTFVIGVAVLNAQLFVYTQFGLALADGAYQAMFYALTGTFMALLILGLVYDLVVVFRFLGGRSAETELVSAHALYWYFLMATYTALWFVVYVQK